MVLRLVLRKLHGLEQVLVEVGEFIDEVRVDLEDDVEIAHALEDQSVEEVDQLLEVIELVSVRPLAETHLEVVEVQHCSIL